jgi:DNA-directed RNA polymerase specialized sigma24 family protein
MVMKTVYSVEDFFKYNHQDLLNIMQKSNKMIFINHDHQDITQHFYLHAHRTQCIQRWDENKTASFSTYMFRCISNFIRSYYYKPKKEIRAFKECLSLSNSLDGQEGQASFMERVIDPVDHEGQSDLKLDMIKFDKYLKSLSLSKRKLTLHNLLQFYIQGYTDMDIHREVSNITVAGIGVQKRYIGTLLKKFNNPLIQQSFISKPKEIIK